MEYSPRPLRILMVLHMPWERTLGGSRVQLELAEEFRKMGHQVEKFDYNDAFPRCPSSRLHKLFPPSFSKRAVSFVRREGRRFDVIDAHQTNLPLTKSELGYAGLLVARSVGLVHFCDEFSRLEAKIWRRRKGLKFVVRDMLERPARIRYLRSATRSFQTADLINVPNPDEYRYISEEMGLGHKCRVLPFGLTESRLQKFAAERRPPLERYKNKQVAFVGVWAHRKGAADWSAIIHAVRRAVPTVSFLFLGTGCRAENIFSDLKTLPCDWIRVVPGFSSDDLPTLLAPATVGAYPSYIDGFGFAVLEKLAAGLPTVAYDVPGPRSILGGLPGNLMVAPGKVKEFAGALVSLLSLPIEHYAGVGEECHRAAQRYRWSEIATQTVEFYRDGMKNLGFERAVRCIRS